MKKFLLLSITILMFAFTLPAIDVGLRDNPKYGYVMPSQADVAIANPSRFDYEFTMPQFNYFVTTKIEQATICEWYGNSAKICPRGISVESPLIIRCSSSNYNYNINYKHPVKQGVPRYTIANIKVNSCNAPKGKEAFYVMHTPFNCETGPPYLFFDF